MGISYAFLGMLCMLDCLLFGNYAIVSALRALSNAEAEADEDAERAKAEQTRSRESEYHPSPWENLHGMKRLYTAIFLSIITKEPSSTRSFPKWRVVYAGIISTSLLLIISTIILSPEVVINLVVADPTSSNTSANFCITEDFDAKIAQLEVEINDMTGIDLARRQHDHTVSFHEALVSDTSLYGTQNYQCPDILNNDGTLSLSGDKNDWQDRTVPPASVNGDFFPGYCGAALQAAIDAAKDTTCSSEFCDCPYIPQLFGPPIKTCLGGVARICVDIPRACPKHTQDEEQELQDYRQVQLRTAEEERDREFEDSTFPVDVPEELILAGESTAQKILFQVDVASSLYVAYSILSLIFPAPLVLFRPPFSEFIRIYLFGAHKLTFILFVICVWWGVEYFQMVMISPEIKLYLRNLRDPCFLDGDYVLTRQNKVNAVCKDLVPMEGAWQRSMLTIQHVLVEASHFINTCSCAFPIRALGNFRTPEHITVADAAEIGFGTKIDGFPSILTPTDFQNFVGDSTICTDSAMARSLVMEASEAETNWWQLWVATGLLARILIKVAVCNFGIALYRMADPLSICAGRFEWPSARFQLPDSTSRTLEQVKREKSIVYQWVAFKAAIGWGILTHICLINLMLTAWSSGGGVTELHADEKLGIAAFAIGLFSLPAGWFTSTRINLRRMQVEERHSKRVVRADSENPSESTTPQKEIPVTIPIPDADDEFEIHTNSYIE